jgi:hypothetical protein
MQEERLRAAGGKWKKAFFMPSTPDGTVRALRTWLDAFGGGSGPCSGTGQGDLPRLTHRESIDRFETHTKHCPSCNRVRGGALGALASWDSCGWQYVGAWGSIGHELQVGGDAGYVVVCLQGHTMSP